MCFGYLDDQIYISYKSLYIITELVFSPWKWRPAYQQFTDETWKGEEGLQTWKINIGWCLTWIESTGRIVQTGRCNWVLCLGLIMWLSDWKYGGGGPRRKTHKTKWVGPDIRKLDICRGEPSSESWQIQVCQTPGNIQSCNWSRAVYVVSLGRILMSSWNNWILLIWAFK